MDPRRRPAKVVNVDTMVAHGRKVCGHVTMIPGVHKDWLCHQFATPETGRCRTHSPQDAFPPKPKPDPIESEAHKRSNILRSLGLHKEFSDYRADPEILELRHELALLDLRISSVLQLLKKENTKENDKRFIDLLKVRRQYVEDINKSNSDGVPKERVKTFIYALINVMFEFLPDPEQKAKYLAKIRELTGRPGDLKMPAVAPPTTIDATAVPQEGPSAPA